MHYTGRREEQEEAIRGNGKRIVCEEAAGSQRASSKAAAALKGSFNPCMTAWGIVDSLEFETAAEEACDCQLDELFDRWVGD
jgi:hypothetical protein